jgi:NitT/TauT family transport system ATP-binding protein
MCDRILVLGANPGHIAAEIQVPLPQPRDRLDPAFHAIVDRIYSILTSRMTDATGASCGGLGELLPEVSTNRISGFVETLAAPPYLGRADLARIAPPLALEINDLFPIAAALHLLEFAELKDGSIKLTTAGRIFAQSSTDERKRLFREHLLRFVPLAGHIRQVLEEREEHHAPRDRFEFELQDHLSARDAERSLRSIIGWGRYAELFAYDDRTRTFELGHAEDRVNTPASTER